jgi:hypothetical protein
VNITVYLPDKLGMQAKDAGLPLSRLLRSAVERALAEVAEMDRVASAWPYSHLYRQEEGDG